MVFNVILRYQNCTEGEISYQRVSYYLLVIMVVAEVRTSSKSSCFCSSTSSTSSRKKLILLVYLRPFACWDCGFESHRGHKRGYLSLVSVVYCQGEVSVSGWSLAQRSPTD